MTALDMPGQRLGMPGQAQRGIVDAPHHGPDLRLQHAQGKTDLADLIAAAGVDRLAQGVVGDLPAACRQPGKRAQGQVGQHPDQRAPQHPESQFNLQRLPTGPVPQRQDQRKRGAGLRPEPGLQAQAGQALAPGQTPATQPAVPALGGLDLRGVGPGSHRLVFDGLTIAGHRRGIGTDPVVIAILAAVLHQAHP